MNKIAALLKQGWTITEVRYDRWQKWFYAAASHETGEAPTAVGSGESLIDAIDVVYQQAITSTPRWYLDQIKAGQS